MGKSVAKIFEQLLQSLLTTINSSEKPFNLGIVGPSASGKSTLAEFLKNYLTKQYPDLTISIIPLDNFIYSNSYLTKHNLMQEKGFPNSFNWKSLQNFVEQLQIGEADYYPMPFYSHDIKDIHPEKTVNIPRSDIYIFEGISLFYQYESFCLSSIIDWSVYLDIDKHIIKQRSVNRFLSAYTDAKKSNHPAEFFRQLLSMPFDEVKNFAENLWNSVDDPAIEKYIKPQKESATVSITSLPTITELQLPI